MNTRLFLSALLTLSGLAFGKDIEVKSGDFAYFGVEVPTGIVAGENRKVTLTAYDAYDNKTNYFGNEKRAFTLKASGSAALDKQSLSPADFESGSVTLTLSDRVAEAVNIGFFESGSPLLVKNMATGAYAPRFNLKVGYAPLGGFDLAVSKKRIAGEAFSVTLTAKDIEGNVISDYSNLAAGVMITAEGPGGKKSLLVPADLFSGGRAEVSLRYDFPGAVRIAATDLNKAEATGNSGVLEFAAQTLSDIEVAAPASIRAGVPFSVELKALNQFDGVMQNYAAVGKDVILTTDGSGKLIPDRVPASAFVQGVARFETLYTKPEPITISAAPAGIPAARAAHALAAPAKRAKAKEIKGAVPKAAPLLEGRTVVPMAQPKIEQKVVNGAPEKKLVKKEEGFPLSLRFDASLGEIERIETAYEPQGELGITRVAILFANGKKLKRVQPIKKEITADGHIIGLLSLDGRLDDEGRLEVQIREKEPFTMDLKNSRNKLELRFFLSA
jgi:hypothetical protein